DELAVVRPFERNTTRIVLAVIAHQPIANNLSIDERPMKSRRITHVNGRRRRVCAIRKLPIGWIRTEDGREDRKRRDDQQQDRTCCLPSRLESERADHDDKLTRGSTIARRTSAARLPMATSVAPTRPQPATSTTSRPTTASYIKRPRPGHDVTHSTA